MKTENNKKQDHFKSQTTEECFIQNKNYHINFAHLGILQFDMNTGCYCHLQIKP